MPASEDTPQERIVASVINESGLRYIDQYSIGKYFADFWIAEIKMVVEADGIYGHYRNADRIRDAFLLENGVDFVVHIKSQSKKGIEEEFWQVLKELEEGVLRRSPGSKE